MRIRWYSRTYHEPISGNTKITWQNLKESIMQSGIWSPTNSGDGTLDEFTGVWHSIGDIVFFEATAEISDSDDWRDIEPVLTLPDGSTCDNVGGEIISRSGDFIARVEIQSNYSLEMLAQKNEFNNVYDVVGDFVIPWLGVIEHANYFSGDPRLAIVYRSSANNMTFRTWSTTFGDWPGDFGSISTLTLLPERFFIEEYSDAMHIFYVTGNDLWRRAINTNLTVSSTQISVASEGYDDMISFGKSGSTVYVLKSDNTLYSIDSLANGNMTQVSTLDRAIKGLVWGSISTSDGDMLAGWDTDATDENDQGLYSINPITGVTSQINNYKGFVPNGFTRDGMIYGVTPLGISNNGFLVKFFPSETTDITLVDPDSDYTPCEGTCDELSDKIRLNLNKRVEDEK